MLESGPDRHDRYGTVAGMFVASVPKIPGRLNRGAWMSNSGKVGPRNHPIDCAYRPNRPSSVF